MTCSSSETRPRQVQGDGAGRVLIGWHNVEVFSARPADRSTTYVGVAASDWGAYIAYHCLDKRTLPDLSNYSSLVLRPCGAQGHPI